MDLWFTMRIESLNESPSAFLASPKKELSQGADFFRARIVEGGDNNVIFGCFDGEILAGSVGLVREGHQKASHKAFIWGMYVRPDYRGRMIGKQLLQSVIEFAVNTMKVKQINLSVESSREPAKKLYSSMGFKKWGTEQNAMHVDGKYYDEDYMALSLSAGD